MIVNKFLPVLADSEESGTLDVGHYYLTHEENNMKHDNIDYKEEMCEESGHTTHLVKDKTKGDVIKSIRFSASGIPFSYLDHVFDYVRISRSGSDICVIGILSDEGITDRGYFVHDGHRWVFDGWDEEGAGMVLDFIMEFQEKEDLERLSKSFDDFAFGLLSNN